MEHANVKRLRDAYAAFAAEDRAGFLAFCATGVTFRPTPTTGAWWSPGALVATASPTRGPVCTGGESWKESSPSFREFIDDPIAYDAAGHK